MSSRGLRESLVHSALTTSSHRLLTILIFLPPVMGAILAGALVGIARVALAGDAAATMPPPPDVRISIAMAAVAASILVALWWRSFRIRAGSPSHFPRAFRAVPYTSAVGFLLGLAAALAQVLDP